MAFAQAHSRSIPGAVATLGVSDRVAFLRRTYAHLGGALIAFAALTAVIMKFAPNFSYKLSTMFGGGGIIGVILFFALFIGVGIVSQRLAASESSRGLQYVGLGLGVVMYSALLQPLIWLLMFKFSVFTPGQIAQMRGGNMTVAMNGAAAEILLQAVVITLTIFVGLTATVFITKKDFSFLRGALTIGLFAVIGVAIASALFGFHLGALYSGVVILLMAGYILYETSVVMRDFPPTHHVAAALMLFGTVATMFFHVLRLVMSLRD